MARRSRATDESSDIETLDFVPVSATAKDRENSRETTSRRGEEEEEDLEELDDSDREIRERAKKLKQELTLPPTPGKGRISFDDAISWMKLLTPKHWTQFVVYLYRTFPKINRKQVDPTSVNNIEKIVHYFDEEYIIRKHGGGAYRMDFNANGTLLFRVMHEIDMGEHDPILNVAELDIGNSKNRAYIEYLQNKGELMIDEKGKPMPTVSNAVVAAQAVADKAAAGEKSAVSELTGLVTGLVKDVLKDKNTGGKTEEAALLRMMDMQAKSAERAIDLVKEQSNPTNMVGMVDKILSVVGSSKGGVSEIMPFLTMMLTMMQESSKQTVAMMQAMQNQSQENMKLMISLMQANQPKEPEDKFDVFERVMQMAKIVKGGDGGGGEWWEKALQHGAPILAPLVQGIAMRGMNAGAPAMPNAPTMPGMPEQYPNVVSMPNRALPPGQGEGQVTGQQPNGEEMLKLALAKYGDSIVNALSEGIDGYAFAESVITMAGRATYLMVANQGVDKIIIAMNASPIKGYLEAVTTPEKLKVWVGEFCTYDEYIAKQEQEQEGLSFN